MAVLNVLNVLSSGFALYLFIVVSRMRIRGREHRLLGLAALALFAWNTLAYAVYNTPEIQIVRVLLPISCVPMYLFFPLVFHFSSAFYLKRPFPTAALLLLYGPGLALGAFSFFVPVSLEPVLRAAGSIELRVPVGSLPTTLWSLYAVGCWMAAVVIAVRHYRTTTLNREKHQGALLVQWLVINLVLILGEFYATAMIPWWTIPSQSPLLMSIWVGAMVYAIWKYGFLRISPGLLAEQILESIEDLVILYDMRGKRVYANRKAFSIVRSASSMPLLRSATHGDPFAETVATLLSGASQWRVDEPERQFRKHLPGRGPHARPLAASVRAKPVVDRYDDPIGVVITATIQPQLKDVLQPYQLTDREAEVLEYLATGLSIAETAHVLSITERTVKAHITSIYQKTGATNRVELLNLAGPGAVDPG